MNLQKRLANLMAERSMTIREIELKSKVPHTSISSILNGYSKNPTARTLKAIAEALDVSLEYIISEDVHSLRQLNKKELLLYKKCCVSVIDIIIENNYQINFDKMHTLLKEIYDYSYDLCNHSDDYSIDNKFVAWILKKNNCNEHQT